MGHAPAVGCAERSFPEGGESRVERVAYAWRAASEPPRRRPLPRTRDAPPATRRVCTRPERALHTASPTRSALGGLRETKEAARESLRLELGSPGPRLLAWSARSSIQHRAVLCRGWGVFRSRPSRCAVVVQCYVCVRGVLGRPPRPVDFSRCVYPPGRVARRPAAPQGPVKSGTPSRNCVPQGSVTSPVRRSQPGVPGVAVTAPPLYTIRV